MTCSGTDPGPVTITSPATSSSGAAIIYQWQESSVECDGAFADLVGETNASFNPPVITTD